jgi:signal transduction histidine kinase
MDHWRLQAVLKEREWLANEMHDTLAQSFAGIGFQLQAIRDAVPDGSPRLRKQVDVAWSLVRHSHKEARRSIEPLSIDAPHEFDLLSALVGSAKKMVGDGSVEVNTESAGPQRAMPPHIYGALLRIGQEAIANAVRHADPRAIGISVSYSAKQVRLAVQDDGCGFVMSASLLGFGLRGMRKRAAAIGARIEIVTEPGFGTCLEVMAPLPPDLTPSVIFKRVWKHVAEMKSNAST